MLQINCDGNGTFYPADTISGTVSWEKLESEPEKVEVRLVWYTKGKGTRDIEIVDQTVIENPPISGKANFRFSIPTRPYSFSGKLVSLVWMIEAIIFPDLLAEQEEFVMSKSAKEIVL